MRPVITRDDFVARKLAKKQRVAEAKVLVDKAQIAALNAEKEAKAATLEAKTEAKTNGKPGVKTNTALSKRLAEVDENVKITLANFQKTKDKLEEVRKAAVQAALPIDTPEVENLKSQIKNLTGPAVEKEREAKKVFAQLRVYAHDVKQKEEIIKKRTEFLLAEIRVPGSLVPSEKSSSNVSPVSSSSGYEETGVSASSLRKAKQIKRNDKTKPLRNFFKQQTGYLNNAQSQAKAAAVTAGQQFTWDKEQAELY